MSSRSSTPRAQPQGEAPSGPLAIKFEPYRVIFRRLESYRVRIPEEVILNVFAFIPNVNDIKTLSLVSKAFNRCAQSVLWRSLHLRLHPRYFHNVPRFFTHDELGYKVRRLDLCSRKIDLDFLVRRFDPLPMPVLIGRVFPNVQHLLVDVPRFNIHQLSRNRITALTIRLRHAHTEQLTSRVFLARFQEHQMDGIDDPFIESTKPFDLAFDGVSRDEAEESMAEWLCHAFRSHKLNINTLSVQMCKGALQFLHFLNVTPKHIRLGSFLASHLGTHPGRACLDHQYLGAILGDRASGVKRLAVLGAKDAKIHDGHNDEIHQMLTKMLFTWFRGMEELTVPDISVMHNCIHSWFIPRSLQILQIHCATLMMWNLPGNLLQMLVEQLEAIVGSLTSEALEKVILWFPGTKGMVAFLAVDPYIRQMEDYLLRADIALEVSTVGTFEETPLAWKGCELECC